MDTNEQTLKEKAFQLIVRERELVSMRSKHQRLLNWLTLSQSLPEIMGSRCELAEIGRAFVKRIIGVIKLQRVHLLELLPSGLRAFGEEQPKLPPLPRCALEWLEQTGSGLINDPVTPAECALSEVCKLYRLLWCRLDALGDHPVLLAGGFDRERALSYPPFDQEDAEYFTHTGRHFESLLKNLILVSELERDKQRLERFNQELELRVQERTLELASANTGLSEAITALQLKERRLHQDLVQARAFQQGILPTLPASGAVEFGAVYQPLDLVGGDIYDVAEIERDHYRVFVADATGHGVQASLRTIVLKSEYDRLKYAHARPESLLAALNHRLLALHASSEMLSTACCFDLKLGADGAVVRYSNAAHPPVYHVSRAGVVELYHDGPFLGLSADVELQAQERPLGAGDLLLAYTDGMSDQPGPNGEIFKLEEAVARAAASQWALPQMLQGLLAHLDRFRETRPLADDVTLVAARVVEPNGSRQG